MTRPSIILPILCAGLFTIQTVHTSASSTAFCEGLLPESAVPAGEVFLCGNGSGRLDDQFACRDYRAGDRIYRVLLRGGAVPREAYLLAGQGEPTRRLMVTGQNCAQPHPRVLPATACFRGAGICKDEQGHSLPCGAYAASVGNGDENVVHYLVFYDPDGNGIRSVDLVAGTRRHHEFEAELAFALGAAQRDIDPDRASSYIAHAATLAPSEPRYHTSRTGSDSVTDDSSLTDDLKEASSLCTLD